MDKAVLDVIGPDSAAAVGLSVREPEVGVSSLTLPAAAGTGPIESYRELLLGNSFSAASCSSATSNVGPNIGEVNEEPGVSTNKFTSGTYSKNQSLSLVNLAMTGLSTKPDKDVTVRQSSSSKFQSLKRKAQAKILDSHSELPSLENTKQRKLDLQI